MRKYWVAELKLKEISSIPMVHRDKPAFADKDVNWEYFKVIEKSEVDKLFKEVLQTMDCSYDCRSNSDSWAIKPCSCGAEKTKSKIKEFLK